MKKFKQFEKIYFPEFVEEVFNATRSLYLSLPSIDEEMAETLIQAKRQNPDLAIYVVIDNSEESIRNGFGDIEGIDKLLQNNIQIFQSEGNLISFIISDQVGYFIFPHSRIFLDKAKGTNAFRIDPGSIYLLKEYFFSHKTDRGRTDNAGLFADAFHHFEVALNELENNTQDQPAVLEFDLKKHEDIKHRLELNPPHPPDLQRQINVYTAKIQFVELKFYGGNLEDRIIQLPKEAIPIKSEELRELLQTRMKMFQDIKNCNEYKEFENLKKEVKMLRNKYLIPITCRPGKSIILIEYKNQFIKELNHLKDKVKNLNTRLLTMLEEGRLNAIDLLKEELMFFFTNYEPEDLKDINSPHVKAKMLDLIINKIVANVKFPPVKEIIDEMSLKEWFYDLTWNDFRDYELIRELEKRQIMNSDDIEHIVRIRGAYEIKK
ncbi:MAG: hypothetical protein KatS3mg031_2136 [Chitinophagales bacterium]|nr:MAG: hypothetical protein KatS3mg031_2136 [Chitinophagales bacterium]